VRAVFLGTGTSVGKTHAVVRLARCAADQLPGTPILCLKPIESGIALEAPGGPPGSSDAAMLACACAIATAPALHPLFRYEQPLSPYAASRQSGKTANLKEIQRWIAQAERASACGEAPLWSLIETAGGVFSPLALRVTNLDLARALEPARWILVAPNCLGVLHAATAACLAMRGAARAPDVLLLTSAERDASSDTNADLLRELDLARAVIELRDGDDAAIDALISELVRAD
jgi:dethiobiotin synthetase